MALGQNVLVIDDDEYIIRAIKKLLEMKNYIVDAAGSVSEFKEIAKEGGKKFDIYLIDVLLPDGSGFDICKIIREKSETPIIFLTSCDDEESITKGLDMGADDYVTKPFRAGELISRMKANLRRNINDKNDLVFGDLRVNIEEFVVEKNAHAIKLSAVEFELLNLLVSNAGTIIRRKTIFEKMWDKNGNFVEDNTLTVTMSRLKSKLGIDNRTGKSYIETIRRAGYRFVE